MRKPKTIPEMIKYMLVELGKDNKCMTDLSIMCGEDVSTSTLNKYKAGQIPSKQTYAKDRVKTVFETFWQDHNE